MVSRRERTAIIVAGMHRSGTSLVALGLRALGVHLHDDLAAPTAHNSAGFGEDRAFVQLHRAMFESAWNAPGDPAAGHHHDWGYDPAESFDTGAFEALAERARALLDGPVDGDGTWGWKDPRTTLVLDQWARRIRDPRVLLVVRHPD